MWARFRYRLRQQGLQPGQWLSSWQLSVVLIVAATLYNGLLAAWAISSPAEVVAGIAVLSPFWLLYGLLLLNTALCFAKRLPGLRHDISSAPRLHAREPAWTVPAATEDPRRTLEQAGYRVVETEEGLHGIKRRFAALGSFVFHGSFFVLAIGFLLSSATRHESRAWVAAGESFEGRPDQYLSHTHSWLRRGEPSDPTFTVEAVAPEYWGSELLFTELRADLSLPNGRRLTTRINQPRWTSWGTTVRLAGFGWTPRYEIRNRDGRVLASSFVKMNVFPPGRRDSFTPEGLPHRIYTRLYPDAEIEEDGVTTRTMNLVNPAVEVEVWRGRVGKGGAVLATGEYHEFEGLLLTFPEIRSWGEFAIVHDQGSPIVVVGYLLALSGLLMKLRGGRAEVGFSPATEEHPAQLRGWGTARRLPS